MHLIRFEATRFKLKFSGKNTFATVITWRIAHHYISLSNVRQLHYKYVCPRLCNDRRWGLSLSLCQWSRQQLNFINSIRRERINCGIWWFDGDAVCLSFLTYVYGPGVNLIFLKKKNLIQFQLQRLRWLWLLSSLNALHFISSIDADTSWVRESNGEIRNLLFYSPLKIHIPTYNLQSRLVISLFCLRGSNSMQTTKTFNRRFSWRRPKYDPMVAINFIISYYIKLHMEMPLKHGPIN